MMRTVFRRESLKMSFVEQEMKERLFVLFWVILAGIWSSSIGIQGAGATEGSLAASHAGNVQRQDSGPADKIFRSISPAEAMRMLQTRDDIVFFDVRTAKERANGAIPGSKLVSLFNLVKGQIPLPKDKPILLVCAVGGRSYVAGQVLSKQGYREVYNLSGGIKAWYQAGLPVVQDPAFSGPAAGR